MSVRATMSDLITAVRTLIFDPNPQPGVTVTQFTDQQIQDALDHTRQDVNYLELAPKETIQAGGAVVWLDYYAMVGSVGVGDWENDVVLQGYPSFTVLSPITSDQLVGHWTFDTSQSPMGQRPPAYLIGKTYDRYGAAVELLEDWAASLKLNYRFTSDRQAFFLSEQVSNILSLSARHQQKMRPKMLQMTRQDLPNGLWQRGAYDISRTTF